MDKILGVPEELWVRVTRKRSDSDYGSYGVEAELKVNLANVEDLNLDDAFAAVDAWLTAAVAGSVKTKEKLIGASMAQVPETAKIAQEAPGAPPPAIIETPPPAQSTSVPPEIDAVETWQAPTVSHQVTDGGIDYLNVRGDNWTKYGTYAWPELVDEYISLPWREWPIGNRYGLPDGLKEAIIRMKTNKKGDTVPDRVIEFS